MIPESVKARIQKEARAKYTKPNNPASGLDYEIIDAQEDKISGYISGATAEYERAQQEHDQEIIEFVEHLGIKGKFKDSEWFTTSELLKLFRERNPS